MGKLYFKRYVTDMATFTGLLTFLNALWEGLEILFDGGVQPSISDSIIGSILVIILWLKIRKWISIRDDVYSD